MCYNCVDRHVKEGNGDRVAFFWEGNDVGQATTTTYKELQDMVCQVRRRVCKCFEGKGGHRAGGGGTRACACAGSRAAHGKPCAGGTQRAVRAARAHLQASCMPSACPHACHPLDSTSPAPSYHLSPRRLPTAPPHRLQTT